MKFKPLVYLIPISSTVATAALIGAIAGSAVIDQSMRYQKATQSTSAVINSITPQSENTDSLLKVSNTEIVTDITKGDKHVGPTYTVTIREKALDQLIRYTGKFTFRR